MTDGGSRGVDELWLDTLQRIYARGAHEIRDALNGVSVNLEVVRSRTMKAESPAASVSGFATSAAGQLEIATRMVEALLTLGRTPREPAELGATLAHLDVLLGSAARGDGGRLVMEPSVPPTPDALRSDGNIVRLVLGAALLAALDRKCVVTCRTELRSVASVTIDCSEGGALQLPPDIVDAAVAADIRVDSTRQGLSLAFPRAVGRTPGTA